MTRILAVADEVDEGMYGEKLQRLRPDVILSCGDLPCDYLENLASRVDAPVLYVPGNHDPDLRPSDMWSPLRPEAPITGPQGCINIDGHVVEAGGIRVAGIGGSMRYRPGPNQYSEAQMRWRVLRIEMLVRLRGARGGRRLDVLLTHAPPDEGGAGEADLAHRGFAAFNRLINDLRPSLHFHGHVHPYGTSRPVRRLGRTSIVNAIPYQLVEV